jgi:hypothetical protein
MGAPIPTAEITSLAVIPLASRIVFIFLAISIVELFTVTATKVQ